MLFVISFFTVRAVFTMHSEHRPGNVSVKMLHGSPFKGTRIFFLPLYKSEEFDSQCLISLLSLRSWISDWRDTQTMK